MKTEARKSATVRRGIRLSCVVFLVVAATFLFGGAASGMIVGGSFGISGAGGDEVSPSIGGEFVVWEDRSGSDSDIRGKNLETREDVEVSSAGGDQSRPKTDGDFVVWEDRRNDPGGDVYAYDLGSGAEVSVANGAASQRRPDISGGKVVWEENRGSGWKLYGHDLIANAPFVVSESPGDKYRPAISGDLVVWENHPATGRSDIFGKQLGSGSEFAVADDSSVFEDAPSVSGSTVVWREEGSGSDDVYGKDLETGEEFEVCVDAADQHSPAISGKLVVWTDGRGSGADVFGKDLETGEEFEISDASAPEESPSIADETVAWESQNDGETNFGEWDIRGSTLDANPTTPENLAAVGTTGGVDLSWSPNVEADFHHFDVYRKDDDGVFRKINSAPLSAPGFTDADAPKGIVSRYEVRAVDGAGQNSAPASAGAAATSNTTSTLAASATSVRFGETVDFSGHLASEPGSVPIPDAEVVLEASPAGTDGFEEVSTDDTGSDGSFAFANISPRTNTDYRAVFVGNPASGFEPSVSGDVRVEVIIPATSISASVSPSVVDFGNAVSVSGRLVSGGAGVVGREVVLEARTEGAASFSEMRRLRTSSGGAYSFGGLRPGKHTHYRVRFAGEVGTRPSVSESVEARVRAVVSTSVSAKRVMVGRAVVVSGTVSPAHTGSVSVTVRGNGRVVSKKDVSLVATTNSVPLSGSRYRYSYVPKKAGRYTVEVAFGGDGDHLGASGPVRSFTAR